MLLLLFFLLRGNIHRTLCQPVQFLSHQAHTPFVISLFRRNRQKSSLFRFRDSAHIIHQGPVLCPHGDSHKPAGSVVRLCTSRLCTSHLATFRLCIPRFRLFICLCFFQLFIHFCLFQLIKIMAVSKRVIHHPVLFKYQQSICHLTDKIPVMRHEKKCPLISTKCRFQHFPGLNIHVIGRLIQNHEIGTALKDFRKHQS